MKNNANLLLMLIICAAFLFPPDDLYAQLRSETKKEFDYPWVPRISAYEAYSKYKAGKALIFHGGGVGFSERHILGAFNLDLKKRDHILSRFPKAGIEIFTYCY